MKNRREELLQVLATCERKAQAGRLTIGEAFDGLGDSTYCFLGISLCLPFLQPFSLGPLSSIGGAAFITMGWQMMRDQKTLWLPEKIRQMALTAGMWAALLKCCRIVFNFCSRFTRPRLQGWVVGTAGRKNCGVLFILGGILLAVPLAGVPMTNFFPALVVLFACLGELEQDGAMLLVAFSWAVVTVTYFILLGFVVFYFGEKVLQWLPF